ncbi:MAG: DUF2357 domain-containing protein [Neobacillus sp.]
MAIPYEGFEVIFSQKMGDQEKRITVDQYLTRETDIYEKREEISFEVKENLGLTITFRSDRDDAQFFMDGLETLPDNRMPLDPIGGEVYLSPSEKAVTLYDHTKEYYPLIPGLYQMVVLYDTKRYYSWIKVLPKQLEESQWERMKQEVEEELKGLARDFLLKKTGLSKRMEGISHGLLERFFIINNRFSSCMVVLSDFYRKVNYRIGKDYVLVPKEKSRLIDEKTIKHGVNHSKSEHFAMTPVNAVTYDLPENRLAKKIIESISKTLTQFIDGVERTARSLKEPSGTSLFQSEAEIKLTIKELEGLREVAGKMLGALQWIKTAPWYESISPYRSSSIPHVMNSDPRYRALYQLYRELGEDHPQLKMHKSYSYQWKRSDKLYEIWGYIQFIKTLIGEGLDFMPESGWIYSQELNGNSLLVFSLPSNTEVVLRKENLKLHLVYEALLPTQSRHTTPSKPLYTRGTHTCPDGRLDVYKDERFIGTIIFDFKYRPRNAIWDENLIYNNKQNEVMRQLVSYGDSIYSPYLFGAGGNPFISRISPVQEVWAVYPKRHGDSKLHEFPDHKVSLIELTPGHNHAHLTGKIKTALDRLVKASETFQLFSLK